MSKKPDMAGMADGFGKGRLPKEKRALRRFSWAYG